MKWVLIIVGGVVGLLIVAAIVGSLLPKGHVASRTVRFRKSTDAVWTLISNFAEQASWRPDLARVERAPEQNGHEVWREVRANGEAMPLETVESVANKKLVRRIADPKMPFGGTWTYELAHAAEGCTLTITEHGEVYNPLFRLVSRFFDMRATIDGYLKALGAKLGEDVRLDG